MKRAAAAALALSFAATTAAFADDGDRQRGDSGGRPQARSEQPAKPQTAPPQAAKPETPQPRAERGGERGDPPEQRPEAAARPVRVQAQAQPAAAAPQVVRPDNGDRRGQAGFAGRAEGGQRQRPPEVRTVDAPPPAAVVRQPRPAGPVGEAVARVQEQQRRAGGAPDGAGRGNRGGETERNDWVRNGEGSWTRNGGDQNANRDGSRTGSRNDTRPNDRNDSRPDDRNGWSRDGGRGGWDRDHHGPTDRPNWARPDGRYDRDHDRIRYDPRRYPHEWRSNHRYRVTSYNVAPYGYYDYGWNYGDYLPWGWYGPSYWLDDWYGYGLPSPPIGCEWIRVGRDAVLVDTFTGQVISVARLLFW